MTAAEEKALDTELEELRVRIVATKGVNSQLQAELVYLLEIQPYLQTMRNQLSAIIQANQLNDGMWFLVAEFDVFCYFTVHGTNL